MQNWNEPQFPPNFNPSFPPRFQQPQQQGYQNQQQGFPAPANRGRSKGKQFNKRNQNNRSSQPPPLPPPSHLQTKTTPTVDSSLFIDSCFLPTATPVEQTPFQLVHATHGAYIDLIDQVYWKIYEENPIATRSLTHPAFRYYCAMLFWFRAIRIKTVQSQSLSTQEQSIRELISTLTFNVPKPIMAYLDCLGKITDEAGNRIYTAIPTWPTSVVDRIGGFWAVGAITAATHNYYEEYPTPGIFAMTLRHSRGNADGAWVPGICPADSVPTPNLLGYLDGTVVRPEAFQMYTAAGITAQLFPQDPPNTGLNMRMVKQVSDFLVKSYTYPIVPFDLQSSCIGKSAFIYTNTLRVGMPDAVFARGQFQSASQTLLSDLNYGIAAAFLFQQYKEGADDCDVGNTLWCCIGPAANIPQAWVQNRNALRDIDPELISTRFLTPALSGEVRRKMVVDGYSKPP